MDSNLPSGENPTPDPVENPAPALPEGCTPLPSIDLGDDPKRRLTDDVLSGLLDLEEEEKPDPEDPVEIFKQTLADDPSPYPFAPPIGVNGNGAVHEAPWAGPEDAWPEEPEDFKASEEDRRRRLKEASERLGARHRGEEPPPVEETPPAGEEEVRRSAEIPWTTSCRRGRPRCCSTSMGSGRSPSRWRPTSCRCTTSGAR